MEASLGAGIAASPLAPASRNAQNTLDPPPDPASVESATEQDAQEYCESCGRAATLKNEHLGQLYPCTGRQDRKAAEQIGAGVLIDLS
jgi:hypothetical protein